MKTCPQSRQGLEQSGQELEQLPMPTGCVHRKQTGGGYSVCLFFFLLPLSLFWKQYIFSSTCAWTSDSRFFSLRTVGLAPAASWGLSGLQPQTEVAALSAYPVLRLLDLGQSHATGFYHSPACRWPMAGLH